eukprot:PhM_4_TR14860/c0_g1_i1/m.86560
MKVWIKQEGVSDDDALKVTVEDDADISDLLNAAAPLFHFDANYKVSQLHILDGEQALSNRGDVAPHAAKTLVIKPREGAVGEPHLTQEAIAAAAVAAATAAVDVTPKPVRAGSGSAHMLPQKRPVTAAHPLPVAATRAFTRTHSAAGPPSTTPKPREPSATPRPSATASTGSASARSTSAKPVDRKAPAAAVSRPPVVPKSTPRATPSKDAHGPMATATAKKDATPPAAPTKKPHTTPSSTSTPRSVAPKATPRSSAPTSTSSGQDRLLGIWEGMDPTKSSAAPSPACSRFTAKWGIPNTCESCGHPKAMHSAGNKSAASRSSTTGPRTSATSARSSSSKPVHVDPVAPKSTPEKVAVEATPKRTPNTTTNNNSARRSATKNTPGLSVSDQTLPDASPVVMDRDLSPMTDVSAVVTNVSEAMPPSATKKIDEQEESAADVGNAQHEAAAVVEDAPAAEDPIDPAEPAAAHNNDEDNNKENKQEEVVPAAAVGSNGIEPSCGVETKKSSESLQDLGVEDVVQVAPAEYLQEF